MTTSAGTEWIVHLCTTQAWQSALMNGDYRAASLETEGFIHCSRPQQILWVANEFYPGEPDLLLLWIDTQLIRSGVVWDSVGDRTFPHIYAPINLEAVRAVSDFNPDPDGVFRIIAIPEQLAGL